MSAGNIEGALALFADALDLARKNGELFYLAEILRLTAEALLAQPVPDRIRAEHYLIEALKVARSRGKVLGVACRLRARQDLVDRRATDRGFVIGLPGLWLVHRGLRRARIAKRQGSRCRAASLMGFLSCSQFAGEIVDGDQCAAALGRSSCVVLNLANGQPGWRTRAL
jgi:hypothetical protein